MKTECLEIITYMKKLKLMLKIKNNKCYKKINK